MASEVVLNGDNITGCPGGHRSSLETYSLTILVKFLKFTDPKAIDEDQRLKLLLNCGKSSVNTSGTLASLNKEKLGNVIGLQSSGEHFIRFLNESTIEVTLTRDKATIGKGQLRLQDTRVIHFDPHREDSQPVLEEFPLHDGQTDKPIGVVTMVLHAERNAAPADPITDGQLDTDDIMYVVNENRRRSTDQQEALQRQLLVCNKCNVLRSPEDFSCQYELVDGILHTKTVTSTEQEIERIKQKLRDVALDETIGHRESFSTNGGDAPSGRICGLCRGLTISGVTCGAAEPSSIVRKPSTGKDQPQRQQAYKESPLKPATVKMTTNVLSRCCDRCKTCLNWLPEACRCPKCGHKTREAETAERATNHRHLILKTPSDIGMPVEKPNSPVWSNSNTMVASSQSCPICHVRQCRCVDCACDRSASFNSCSVTSEFLMPEYGAVARPITRRSTNAGERNGYGAVARPITRRSTNAGERKKRTQEGEGLHCRPFTKRSEQLRQTYGTRQNSKAGLQPSSGKGRLTGAQIRKNHNIFIRKVKQQNRNLYSYRFGRRHSGMVVGHKACMKQEQLVPAHMGWRWNTCTAGIGKRRPGWRPGAVRKPIEQLMQHFLKCYPTDNVPVTGKRVVKFEPPSADRPLAGQKPTLHITKQHGEYSITMNPLKDSETLKTTTDAYLPCKPIKFRLSKDPRLTKLFMLRDELKAKGLTLCGCRELERCEHRSEREKRLLVDELRRTAKRFGLPLDTSVADLPSRSESELDVEFTPPSAIIRPGERRPDVVFAETQYCAEDFQIKPPAVEKRQGPKKATSSAMSRDMPASLAGKVPASRTLGGASGHGKGDGAARAPETSAKKIPAGANAPGRKSTTLPKGGDGAKRGTPAEPEVKGTGVRISVAKAKGPPKK
uniref:DUF4776 domain-containing protein n=1 Tax=Anopheles atroparvus TaxID=41427 RepID=A0AAG5CWV9_ANOAO